MEFPKLLNAVIESETPSYLKILHESNAILVRKKKDENNTLYNNSYIKHVGNDFDDLNLTGTPLECPFQRNEDHNISDEFEVAPVSWSKNEENHFPFKITDAINYLTTYNLDYKGNDNTANQTVWMALDGTDTRKTVLMGFLIEGDWRFRKTVCQSTISFDGLQEYSESVKKTYMLMSGTEENSMNCKVSMVYDIVRKSSDNDDVPSIKLHSTWNSLLLRKDVTTPPPDAVTTLSVEMKCGTEQSKINHLWNQLTFLNELIQITGRKEVAMPESVLARTDTMSRVVELVKASDGYDLKCGSLDAKDVVAGNVADVVKAELNTRDFTSKLWELLICCKSCSELVECLEFVCDQAVNEKIAPYIHPQNDSYFAKLIVDLCSGVPMSKYFSLTAARALDMLKEIGVNALQRSYTYMLLTSNWCSSYQLHTNIPKDNQMARLGQLHVLLDLFLTANHHLNLPLQCLQCLFAAGIINILEKFRTFEDVLQHCQVTFDHRLRLGDVESHLTKHFTSWEMIIERDPQNVKLQLSTICHVGPASIFPPPLAISALEETASNDDHLCEYTLLTAQLTVIGNKIVNSLVAAT